MLNLILRVIVCAPRFGTMSVLSILFALFMFLVPKNAFALDAQDCITQVENVTYDNVRYYRITRADRKECDLYMIAKNFPQLGEDGKPLPIRQQLRSIKAANDMLMKGKRGVRPVHSHCVPDSKPPADQTMIEREMCADQLVNYYPVTAQILVPRVPQLSESEQVQRLSEATCKALSTAPNPSRETKMILTECQKHFAGIVIPLPSVSPEEEQLTQARAEVAELLATASEQSQNIVTQKTQIASLAGSKKSWSGVAVFFAGAFGIAFVVAVQSRRKQSKLQDLANIRHIEMEKKIAEAIEERAGGPSKEAHEAVMQEQTDLRVSLQRVTDEKTELSQQIVGLRQQYEKREGKLRAEVDSLNVQVASLGGKRDELALRVRETDTKLQSMQIRHDVLVKERVDLKTKADSLYLQLTQLYETEQGVRREHQKRLIASIELARQVIAQLDERYRKAVANNENKTAEVHAERLNALQQILTTTVGECEARSLALKGLVENDPRKAGPECFLRVLTRDAEVRDDNLANVFEMNITLGKQNNQLASDYDEALEQVAQLRAENSRLQEQWHQYAMGTARGLGFGLELFGKLDQENQAYQLALEIGNLKTQKTADGDLREQVTHLQDQCDDLRSHNASLREAMNADEPRKQMATLIYTATAAEAEVAKMGRLVDRSRDDLKAERGAKARLQEAVRAQSSAGLFALEAPELAVLPTQRLMQFLQTCVLAVQQKPDSALEAEYVLGSDADVGALKSFLHTRIVGLSGYVLPPWLRTNVPEIQVFHAANEPRFVPTVEAQRIPSAIPTMPPPVISGKGTDIRKQTMQGLGAMSDRKLTKPYLPEFDLARDLDEEGKPTH